MKFVDVILPLNLPQTLTYGVPIALQGKVQIGMRVEVNLGKNKLYSAVVLRIHDKKPETYQIKPIKNIIDDQAVVSHVQLMFWEWVAQYYMCSLGEVMQAALPAHLKLMSETLLVWNDLFTQLPDGLSDDAFILGEALLLRNKISISEARSVLNDKNPASAIEQLLSTEVIFVSEILEDKYKPKTQKYITLHQEFSDELQLKNLFDILEKKPKQLHALMTFLHSSDRKKKIPYQALVEQKDVSKSAIDSLIKNGIFKIENLAVNRILDEVSEQQNFQLSTAQSKAYSNIQELWHKQNVVLLQGVTGSGKTLIYIELIRQVIVSGKQALILLPEIALTTQIVSRLKHFFGEELGVYHSRFSNNERVEIWKHVQSGKYKVVLGPRSVLWLPYQKLGLIIIDEEHDSSYKQHEPAPRFHARDAAIYLAQMYQSKVLLGSATPSLETVYNVQHRKYGYVALSERYQNISLPQVEIVSAKNYHSALSTIITQPLLEAIVNTLNAGKQVILFQNKRGYAPFLICPSCGWVAHCKNCDISLTYHKSTDKLHCHYCGTRWPPIHHCQQCGNSQIVSKSFGTEKIEEDLQRILPKVRTARMDWDSVKGKNKHAQLIDDFARGRIDILVGTQMVVKGLDFAHVGLVGIISADSLLSYPDFRVHERAFQLMQQVAGRAGRADGNGHVIIQANNRNHPVLNWVKTNDSTSFYNAEMQMREAFQYPPFVRMIKIIFKHRDENKAIKGAEALATLLTSKYQIFVQGPAAALVPRVRNMYIQEVWIKIVRDQQIIQNSKLHIAEAINEVLSIRGNSSLQIIVDVDTL